VEGWLDGDEEGLILGVIPGGVLEGEAEGVILRLLMDVLLDDEIDSRGVGDMSGE
jgi:hypothetical protein